MSQFVGFRPTMGGSVIRSQEAMRSVREEGRVRFWTGMVRFWEGRVRRLAGGLVMAREEMGRKEGAVDRRMVRRRMMGWIDGWMG